MSARATGNDKLFKVDKLDGELLTLLGEGHPERRFVVRVAGKRYVSSPFTWAELAARLTASDDAIGDAMANLVQTGAAETARKQTRFLPRALRGNSVTLFFITPLGKTLLP